MGLSRDQYSSRNFSVLLLQSSLSQFFKIVHLMNLKSVNIYGAYLQTIQGYSIANSFTQKTLFVAKIQFNSLGPNLLLNSNRSFSSILLPPILYHTCTTPISCGSTFRVKELKLRVYCTLLQLYDKKNKNYNQVF